MQLRVLVQVGEHFVFIRIFLQNQIDANVIGRKITDLGHQRQFPAVNQLGNAFDQVRFVDGIRNRGDLQHAASLFCAADHLTSTARYDRPLASAVDFSQLFFRVDHLSADGKVRSLHRIVGNQLIRFDLGIFQQFQQRVAQLF